VCTTKSVVDLDFILDIGAFDFESHSVAVAAAEAIEAASVKGGRAAVTDAPVVTGQPVDGHGHGHGGRQPSAPHKHDDTVTTATVEALGDVDAEALEVWLGSLLWDHRIPGQHLPVDSVGCGGNASAGEREVGSNVMGGSEAAGGEAAVGDEPGAAMAKHTLDILRMKAVISVRGQPHRAIVQGVHELFDKDYTTEWGADEPRRNRLIFIGRGLDAGVLKLSFSTLLL
jgi:G3E family GTPase